MADIDPDIQSVKLAALDFEGPLDLLVYLVQTNEVDIYDIPIALIAEQFLEYVESMTPERLAEAGDFLLMAATLLRIKAQMLLPQPTAGDEEKIEDPRRELVLKIIEYQQFLEIAEHLREHESARRLVFPRGYRDWVEEDAAEDAAGGTREGRGEPGGRASLADLLRAFAALMRQAERDRAHRLEPLPISIEDKVRFIRRHLLGAGRTTLRELFLPAEPRAYWIVTFIALLEMAREGELRLRQGDTFGEVHVYPGKSNRR
ncbi:MAG TPA: segregation/condensation protein A [Gemmatimonadota bacterium]|nr:segregation/condensation protein A [Gemmatimonadota bacterium]